MTLHPATQPNRVWLNDGNGSFTDSGQTLGNSPSQKIGFGDIDGDGDLDAYVANANGVPNKLWLNDGFGNFSDSGLAQGTEGTLAIGLGDFDNNGTLDVWVANNSGVGDELWTNLNVPATGLSATNDSPTLLGNTTTLTASTVSTATNVNFMWDFGDGQQGSGAIITHDYSAPGVYTATVTVVKCDSFVQAATVVTITAPDTPTPTPSNTPTATPTSTPTATPTSPTPPSYKIYVPIMHQYPIFQ